MSEPTLGHLRPFRAVAWGAYLFLSVGFSMLIVVSVYRSVLKMSPPHLDRVPSAALSEAECWLSVRERFESLEVARKQFADVPHAARVMDSFMEFRQQWLMELRTLESRCAVDGRPELALALSDVEHLLDLYTTGAVQFGGFTGSAVDAFKQRLRNHPAKGFDSGSRNP